MLSQPIHFLLRFIDVSVHTSAHLREFSGHMFKSMLVAEAARCLDMFYVFLYNKRNMP